MEPSGNRRRICFITTSSVTLETFVLETANDLYHRSHFDVTFICAPDPVFAASLPGHIRYLPLTMKRGIGLSGLLAPIKLWGIFKRHRFDLVQYSTPNASLYAAIAAWAAGVPVRLYGQWGIRYVGMNGLARSIFKRLEKITCTLSTDIRSVSFKNLEFAVQEGLFGKGRAQVLGQGGTIGVDLSLYDIENKSNAGRTIRKRYGIGDEFVFGIVGRLSRDKGANEILRAFQTIRSGTFAKLLCVGSLESGIDPSLYRWAKECGDIVFTGQVARSDMSAYYAAFDCFVHPSYREGFGMVLQEAGAMGCAILTTDIPGASEVMEEGRSCLLAKAGDAESLEEKMRLVMKDPGLRERLGYNARKRVEQCYERRHRLEIQRLDYEQLVKQGIPR
jgi:glycosyltransferase involved in cell wall biosynthesis